MTDKSAAVVREFCQEWCGLWDKTNSYLKPGANFPINHMISDLTALISEHYVSKELYEEEKKSNALLHKAMVTAEKGGHDKAMEEISEHYYPKEFTEWVAKFIDIGDLWESQMEKGWILYPDPRGVRKRFKTFDELFNYWKDLVDAK